MLPCLINAIRDPRIILPYVPHELRKLTLIPHEVIPGLLLPESTRCISLKYDFYKGTRRMKLLDSNEIRQLRDMCIFEVNGMEVYM